MRACDDITGAGGFGVFSDLTYECNRFRLYVTRTLASFVVEPSRQRSEMSDRRVRKNSLRRIKASTLRSTASR